MNKTLTKHLLGDNQKIEHGRWHYVPGNQTLIACKTYYNSNNQVINETTHAIYEIDLERCSPIEWAMQVQGKEFASKQVMHDLLECFQDIKELSPTLPVYTSKPLAHLSPSGCSYGREFFGLSK